MPDITTMLSEKESDLVKRYAEEEGIEPEDALRQLALCNLTDRLKFRRQPVRGEVRTFESPESEKGELKSD